MTQAEKRIELFKKHVFMFQNKLGFNDVEIHVLEQVRPDSKASWNSIKSNCQISIFYSKSWIVNPKKLEEVTCDIIIKTAFHEVYEAQFYRIYELLDEKYNENLGLEEIHMLVRRAENTILPIILKEGV